MVFGIKYRLLSIISSKGGDRLIPMRIGQVRHPRGRGVGPTTRHRPSLRPCLAERNCKASPVPSQPFLAITSTSERAAPAQRDDCRDFVVEQHHAPSRPGRGQLAACWPARVVGNIGGCASDSLARCSALIGQRLRCGVSIAVWAMARAPAARGFAGAGAAGSYPGQDRGVGALSHTPIARPCQAASGCRLAAGMALAQPATAPMTRAVRGAKWSEL